MANVVQIALTRGQVTLVDQEDYDALGSYSWHVTKKGGGFYARRTFSDQGKNRHEFLHRVIARATAGSVVDHINGNTLDNRRENLRICTAAENTRNRVKMKKNPWFKGVQKSWRRFRARITVNKKIILLGSFATAEDAARAYDAAALRHHGPFAKLNFASEAPPCAR